jgi:hypothetical protein
MGLERDDVDLDAGVVTIRLTKFGKSRLVLCIRRHARRCAVMLTGATLVSDLAAARPS